MSSQIENVHDTTLANRTLLFLLAAICGAIAAGLALIFEVKIILGLILGLFFGALILLRPLVGMVFLICTMPVLEIFPPEFFGIGLLNPTNLILALVTIASLLYRVMVLKQGINRRSFVLPLVIYGAALIFSATLNLVRGHATVGEMADIVRTYLNGAYLYFVTTNVIRSEKDTKWIFGSIIFAVVFVTVWGLFEYRSSLLTMAAGRVRISGRVGQPNSFGAFLAYYLPFVLAGVRIKGLPRLVKLALIGGTIACFFSLLFTQSRGAYVGLVCTLLFMGFMLTRKLLLVMVVAGLLHPLWLPTTVVDRIMETFTGKSEEAQFDNSTETRIMLYKAGLKMFTEQPVWGHGFGAFSRLSEERGVTDVRRAAHSLYIQMLVDMGLVGVLSIFYMWIHLFRRAVRLRRETTSQYEKIFAESFMASIVAIVVTNIFGIRFYNFLEIGYFWCFSALLVYYTDRLPRAGSPAVGGEVRTAA